MQKIKINQIKNNPNNPRIIKDDKFHKLVKSIKDLPEMASVRPIVVNKDMIVLGGNMRLKAMQEAGWKEVPVEVVDWSEEKQRAFIIKDNIGYGEWDYELLANEWDNEEINEWGLEIPNFEVANYSDKNKEIDIDEFENTMIIKLNYSEEDYFIVRDRLKTIAQTPEQAVWKLLGYE